MTKHEINKDLDVFEDYVQKTINRVNENRSNPSKYIKNNVPDEVIPYRFDSEKDNDNGSK